MSGISRKKVHVSDDLIELSKSIIYANEPVKAVGEYKYQIDNITSSEVIALVHELVKMKISLAILKPGINKLLNLFFKALDNAPVADIPAGNFLEFLQRNNKEMESRLKKLRPLIRSINDNPADDKVKQELLEGFLGLEAFDKQYIVKENVLFPALEKKWPDFSCLKVMWSFHDDIRNNRKELVKLLSNAEWDLKRFNKLTGDLFFNMLAIKFREEKILFPEILKSISVRDLNTMLEEAAELGFPYIQPEIRKRPKPKAGRKTPDEINLETGLLTARQIKLVFNHLPVDITFVDEYNKVCYYSTPATRVFPRAKSIIGRDVKNCHPPSSVHIVEEIIEEFREGKQDKASFWINMGGTFVLIQYFAVRDKRNKYCGVVEVSQEISEIRSLEGEQRLLNWKRE